MVLGVLSRLKCGVCGGAGTPRLREPPHSDHVPGEGARDAVHVDVSLGVTSELPSPWGASWGASWLPALDVAQGMKCLVLPKRCSVCLCRCVCSCQLLSHMVEEGDYSVAVSDLLMKY